MTKRIFIGAGVLAVAALFFWLRHVEDAALSPRNEAVRRPAKQEMTKEKRRQIAELGMLIHAVTRAKRAEADQERKQAEAVLLARHKFEVATKAYEQERFIEAVESFRDAYELVPHPDFLYDAGIAYQRVRNCPEANFYLDWYLEESRRLLDNQDPSISDATPSVSSQMSFALDATRATCR